MPTIEDIRTLVHKLKYKHTSIHKLLGETQTLLPGTYTIKQSTASWSTNHTFYYVFPEIIPGHHLGSITVDLDQNIPETKTNLQNELHNLTTSLWL